MGFLRRKTKTAPADLGTLLLEGEDMIRQLAGTHAAWGLGTADRWGLDQETGLITWTFADRTATAPAQILASHHPSAGSWRWAWANESIRPALSADSRAVRDWGVAHGQEALAQPTVTADAETAATLCALAVRITGATGFYRGSGGPAEPIITFGPVTLTDADGATSTVTVDIAKPG